MTLSTEASISILFAKQIDLSAGMTQKMTHAITPLSGKVFKKYGHALLDPAISKETAKQLSQEFKEDSTIELAIHLYAAALSWEQIYQLLNIPRTAYLATMRAFSRFVKEREEIVPDYHFDRGFWTWRYLCGAAFRIGELEYEMILPPYQHRQSALAGKPCLSIHIPSDAQLAIEGLHQSYRAAAHFFKTYFPDYHYTVMFTDTWLLSPKLAEWLTAGSKIVTFAQDYQILTVEPEKDEGIFWIFRRGDQNFANYPEKTSLQRAAKKSLLQGEHIGSAIGILREDRFRLPF
jgi:hypothetical protein